MFDVTEQGEWEYKSLISLNVTVPLSLVWCWS